MVTDRRWFLSMLAGLCFWRPKPVQAMPGPHVGPCSLKMLSARYGDAIHIECYKFVKCGNDPIRYSFKIAGEWVEVDPEAWTTIRNLRMNSGQQVDADIQMMNCLESLIEQQSEQAKIASDIHKIQIALENLGKRRGG